MVIANYDHDNYRTATDRTFANNPVIRYFGALQAHLSRRSLIKDAKLKSTACAVNECAVKAGLPSKSPSHPQLQLVAVRSRQRVDYRCRNSKHYNLDENSANICRAASS